MKDIVIKKRNLFIALGTILSVGVLTAAPLGVMVMVNKAYEEKWNWWKNYEKINGTNMYTTTFAGTYSGYINEWSLPAENSSYYMKIEDNTWGATQNRGFGAEPYKADLQHIKDLVLDFDCTNRAWGGSGSDPSLIFLTDLIENITFIFGEKLKYGYSPSVISSSSSHTKLVTINIVDKTPTDQDGDSFYTKIVEPSSWGAQAANWSLINFNLLLTKTSGSRGHTKDEWMKQIGITDSSNFTLTEQ